MWIFRGLEEPSLWFLTLKRPKVGYRACRRSKCLSRAAAGPPQLIVYCRAINRHQALFPKSGKTRQPAGPGRRGAPGLRMGFPPTGLSSPPCTGAPDPSTKSLPQCLILRPFTWGHPGQKVPPANTPTPSHGWTWRSLEDHPPAAPHPQEKGPACFTFSAHTMDTRQLSPGCSAY